MRDCAGQLNERKIPFNTLTAVNRENSRHPLEVYRYLRDEIGSRHIQFLPVAEFVAFEHEAPGFWNWERLKSTPPNELVTPWSVEPLEYGEFLTTVFREWHGRDLGTVFVYLFESLLGMWAGYRSALCVTAPSCGDALALDSDGTLYCCDRFCYPAYRVGNVMATPLARLADSVAVKLFGKFKTGLPVECKQCEFLFACNGGCPKNRFAVTPSGQPGLNYLCPGWKQFLTAIKPTLDSLAAQLKDVSRN